MADPTPSARWRDLRTIVEARAATNAAAVAARAAWQEGNAHGRAVDYQALPL
jgi:hypothetical protein